MNQYRPEFIAQVHQYYLDNAVARGEPMTYDELARFFGVGVGSIKAWAKASQPSWYEEAQVAAAANLTSPAAASFLRPVVAQEVRDALHTDGGHALIAEVAEQAVTAVVETEVKPLAAMLGEHQQVIAGVFAMAGRLGKVLGAIPATPQEAEDWGWKPKDILAAARLHKDLVQFGIEQDRILHGQPTALSASHQRLDGQVTVDVQAQVGDASAGDVAAALQRLLGGGDVIDTTFTPDEGS